MKSLAPPSDPPPIATLIDFLAPALSPAAVRDLIVKTTATSTTAANEQRGAVVTPPLAEASQQTEALRRQLREQQDS